MVLLLWGVYRVIARNYREYAFRSSKPTLSKMVYSTPDDTAPSRRSHYPLSLLLVATLVVIDWFFLFVPTVSSTPLRIAISIPLLLFAPGYAVLAALVPEGKTAVDEGRFRGIGAVERITYSVALSLVLVPFLGFAVNFTPGGIELFPVAGAVALLTLSATAVGIYRWLSLPPTERFSLGLGHHLPLLWNDLFAVRSSTDYVITGVLVLSLIAAVGGVAYGVVTDPGDGGHSELFLATETENGTLVLDEYPSDLASDDSRPLVLGLRNQEGERRPYTVAVSLQRIDNGTVADREDLERFEPTLEDGEQWTRPLEVEPTISGEHLRLTYEVYVGGAPSDVEPVEPDYTTYLWINDSSPREADD